MFEAPSLASLPPTERDLLEQASEAAWSAYAPYSGFAVGAAVRSRSGGVHVGANLENAAYGLGICAEVAALTAANTAGDYDITAVAVVGRKILPEPDGSKLVTPCGRCRQIIREAADLSAVDITVLCANGDLTEILRTQISHLLPEAFGPATLGMLDTIAAMRAALARPASKSRRHRPRKIYA